MSELDLAGLERLITTSLEEGEYLDLTFSDEGRDLHGDLRKLIARLRSCEEKLEAAEAKKEHAMTRLRESAAFWKERSDHEYHKPNYPKADRYDAKREALEDVLADLERADSREDA